MYRATFSLPLALALLALAGRSAAQDGGGDAAPAEAAAAAAAVPLLAPLPALGDRFQYQVGGARGSRHAADGACHRRGPPLPKQSSRQRAPHAHVRAQLGELFVVPTNLIAGVKVGGL
jgi:hypothetical protein